MLVAVIMLLTGSSFALGRSAGAAVAGGTIAGESAGTNGTTSCPKGAAPGVSSHQIVIAATVIDLSEGSLTNSTFGVPPVATQDADWNTVANSINKSGGVGCRQIVMHYYDINPADPDAAEQACLNIAATHPFMVLDTGALTEIGASDCLPAHQVPLASGYLTDEQLDQYHPYYLQIGDVPEDIVHNGVLGLKQLEFFDAAKGFRKIGVLYHTCSTQLVNAESSALKAAGVKTSQIVDYSLGCPAGGTDTPAAMEQAVLNFKNAGVTDVMMLEILDGGLFTQVAQQQHFRPQYLYAENDAATNVTTGANAPNPANFNGAVDVLGSAYGEQSTPGYVPSGGTKKCNAIYAAARKPSVYSQTTGYPGVQCDYLWFVQALLAHASSFKASAFPQDMKSMGTVEFSYPFAPTDFAAAPAGATYGVAFWRAAYYHESCKCWQVPVATFHAPFK
ncbi:MAG: hypothetical protein ACLPVF_07530 [Acidimicrobiales bacterium]